ncbi:MAG: 30S ribosomal protein S16 [Desulfatiglandales bacterium]
MPVRLRLMRMGAKKRPFFRIVAAHKEAKRDGRFLEILGFYDPKTDPATVRLKEDRVLYWLEKGAQPTETVGSILKKTGLLKKAQALG